MATAATDYDVFISHSGTDGDPVERVAGHLRDRHGLNPWLDRWVMVPGKPWQDAMAEALETAASCAVFLGVATPSGWFKQEIRKALDRQTRDDAFRVIPVALPGVDPRAAVERTFLDQLTWVEFKSGCDDERALHVLVCGVRGEPPGRWPRSSVPDEAPQRVLQQLRTLADLRRRGLITESVHDAFQIRILEGLLDP